MPITYLIGVCFLAFCIVQRVVEVAFGYRDAEKGHVVAKWTIQILGLIFFTFIIVSFVELVFLRKRLINTWLFFLCFLGYSLILLFRFWAIRSLKQFKSYNVELRHKQVIVKEGPYRYIRHPIYLGMIVESILIPLSVQAYFALLISIFLYIPLLVIRIRTEERVLGKLCGTKYKRYIVNTAALFPKLKGH